jgi:hypothetical protein
VGGDAFTPYDINPTQLRDLASSGACISVVIAKAIRIVPL